MESMVSETTASFPSSFEKKRNSESKKIKNYADSQEFQMFDEESAHVSQSAPFEEIEKESVESQKVESSESGKARKVKFALMEKDSPNLFKTFEELKARGWKSSVEDLVVHALNRVSKDDWNTYLEEITPLEFKLHAALEHPDMRQKLMEILNAR